MTLLDSLPDLFINQLTGSYLLFGLGVIFIVIFALLFLQAGKHVILGVLLVLMFGLMRLSIIPTWSFFIVIIIIGVTTAKGLFNLFFSPR